MDESIFNGILKSIIHASAVLSVWKPKNKIVHIILECIYCLVISFLPTITITCLLVVGTGRNESVDTNINIVIRLVAFLIVGSLMYFVISNRDEEKTLEEYLLIVALYIDVCKKKPQIKRYKSIVITEVMHFLLLFIVVLLGILSLIETLKILSFDTIMTGIVLGIFLSYTLFVYGKCEKKIRQRRKAILGVFISVVWLILVGIRIHHYLKNMTPIGLEDMFILFFSTVFTIPTIYEQIKYIYAKLVESYSKEVYKIKDEILKIYSKKKAEYEKIGVQFFDELKERIKFMVFRWKNGEKKKIISKFFYIFVMIVIIFVTIWLGHDLSALGDELIECVKLWFANLSYGTQKIINKIFVSLFLIGMMLWAVFMAPRNYSTKREWIEKIKYIVALIIFEIVFGITVVMILFFL